VIGPAQARWAGFVPNRYCTISTVPEEDRISRGERSSYTDKQKRQAERRAWATVNKAACGGAALAGRSAADRSAAANKGWQTRRRSQG